MQEALPEHQSQSHIKTPRNIMQCYTFEGIRLGNVQGSAHIT